MYKQFLARPAAVQIMKCLDFYQMNACSLQYLGFYCWICLTKFKVFLFMHKSYQIKFPCHNIEIIWKYISNNIFVRHNQIKVYMHNSFFRVYCLECLIWVFLKFKSKFESQIFKYKQDKEFDFFLFCKQSSILNGIINKCVAVV